MKLTHHPGYEGAAAMYIGLGGCSNHIKKKKKKKECSTYITSLKKRHYKYSVSPDMFLPTSTAAVVKPRPFSTVHHPSLITPTLLPSVKL